MTGTTLEPRSLDAVLDHVTRELDPGASACEVVWATVDGERVVVKVAVGRTRAKLRREAEALARIGAAGLVTVVRLHESDTLTAMVMADAGQHTLEHPGDAAAEVLLRALQHTCRIVDELHRAGWCHGRLTPDHVIVGARGRVRLCSLGVARPASDRPDGVADDLRSLRELVGHVATALDSTGGHARATRRLRRIADEADGQVRGLHRAAGLADQVAAIHQANGPARTRWAPRWTGGSRSRWLAALGLLCGALALGAAATSLPLPRAGGIHAGTDTGAVRVAPLPADPRTDPTGEADAPPPTTRPVAGPVPTVVLDGATYRVGLPGDVPAIGDWDCDGTATVRLLRPGTGELFEFESSGPDGATSAGVVHRVVDGATGLRADRSTGPEMCDRTVVRRADGTDQVVP